MQGSPILALTLMQKHKEAARVHAKDLDYVEHYFFSGASKLICPNRDRVKCQVSMTPDADGNFCFGFIDTRYLSNSQILEVLQRGQLNPRPDQPVENIQRARYYCIPLSPKRIKAYSQACQDILVGQLVTMIAGGKDQSYLEFKSQEDETQFRSAVEKLGFQNGADYSKTDPTTLIYEISSRLALLFQNCQKTFAHYQEREHFRPHTSKRI